MQHKIPVCVNQKSAAEKKTPPCSNHSGKIWSIIPEVHHVYEYHGEYHYHQPFEWLFLELIDIFILLKIIVYPFFNTYQQMILV